jgi:hypothetical protein
LHAELARNISYSLGGVLASGVVIKIGGVCSVHLGKKGFGWCSSFKRIIMEMNENVKIIM